MKVATWLVLSTAFSGFLLVGHVSYDIAKSFKVEDEILSVVF